MVQVYARLVDPLREHDIRLARETAPATKLAQALELMQMGLRLKRATLRRLHPDVSEQEIERLFAEWLERDD